MSEQTLFSPASSRSGAPTFLRVLSTLAMISSLLLVAVACAVFPDSADRARLVVSFFEGAVIGIGAALALRALYLAGDVIGAAGQRLIST